MRKHLDWLRAMEGSYCIHHPEAMPRDCVEMVRLQWGHVPEDVDTRLRCATPWQAETPACHGEAEGGAGLQWGHAPEDVDTAHSA
ncbi:MAG: hypothetical protein GF320_08490 [Armatimonadia bacterium]|nr:hypothetical protein [Armatimonadia bacterium]